MKRVVVFGVVSALLLAGCGGGGGSEQGSAEACDVENPPLFEDGTLTVATDRPAYEPWFEGPPEEYSGFEGEVANEVAERMELPITWVVEPFNRSYAPGAKEYDFDINQITITPEREEAVDFSEGYFDNAQGILALEDSPATDAETLSDLAGVKLGAQVGTTSLSFINEEISPESEVSVYDTTNDARSALESGQIDAFVTDLVTTVYLRDFEIDNSVVVGQYPVNEQFGMLFQKDSGLVGCVNGVLSEMKDDGTLEGLEEEYLQQYLEVPELEG